MGEMTREMTSEEFKSWCKMQNAWERITEMPTGENTAYTMTFTVPKEGITIDDPVDHPPHYTYGDIEVIDYIAQTLGAEGFKGYCLGNVIKYISRAEHKNGKEDYKKARWYLDRIIEDL